MSKMDEISHRVEADRARLAQSLDALTETVQPQKMASELTATASDIGGTLARQAWDTVRAQPAGGLLVTIGLGLLAAGAQRQPASAQPQPNTLVDPDDALTGFDARVADADATIKADMTGRMTPPPEASKLKSALNAGLDQLSPQGRKRVIKARQAVISAQDSIERKTRRAARKTESFVHDQPLTVAAIALGFGLLAGTLLPATRREDALLGARRDALMADARNALEEEMLKAKSRAESALAKKTGLKKAS